MPIGAECHIGVCLFFVQFLGKCKAGFAWLKFGQCRIIRHFIVSDFPACRILPQFVSVGFSGIISARKSLNTGKMMTSTQTDTTDPIGFSYRLTRLKVDRHYSPPEV